VRSFLERVHPRDPKTHGGAIGYPSHLRTDESGAGRRLDLDTRQVDHAGASIEGDYGVAGAERPRGGELEGDGIAANQVQRGLVQGIADGSPESRPVGRGILLVANTLQSPFAAGTPQALLRIFKGNFRVLRLVERGIAPCITTPNAHLPSSLDFHEPELT
jgi:hypothetical protein